MTATAAFTNAVDKNIHIDRNSTATALNIKDMSLQLQNGSYLFKDFSVRLKSGDRMVITGPLGCGKSSILRAVLGQWENGSGAVKTINRARTLCLTQKTYFPLTTLKGIVTYPRPAHEFTDAFVIDTLNRVGMGDLAAEMNDSAKDGAYWSRLSGGQQQSIAFARVLLHKPDLLMLDEATSAMDGPAQENFYAMVIAALPDSIIVSISHRPEVLKHHTLHAAFVGKTIDVKAINSAAPAPDHGLGAGPA